MNTGHLPELTLHDLKTLSEKWHVSPHTVRRWVRLGRLVPLRISRRLLFRPEECERFLREECLDRANN